VSWHAHPEELVVHVAMAEDPPSTCMLCMLKLACSWSHVTVGPASDVRHEFGMVKVACAVPMSVVV
jgi:hypothetical protein